MEATKPIDSKFDTINGLQVARETPTTTGAPFPSNLAPPSVIQEPGRNSKPERSHDEHTLTKVRDCPPTEPELKQANSALTSPTATTTPRQDEAHDRDLDQRPADRNITGSATRTIGDELTRWQPTRP
ncbi:hypothetical protein FNV43_RR03625 [Rhamnella rubrinervis]|uniref:Uncharacterized protein n=1 Tax=Rhamnella rubrinervis TaxID=2594499 RepID=A0A8K0MP20_9ROSA|nr:hypothetical protein FNV43_RR03625 [Rhamnella rubrinervis]